MPKAVKLIKVLCFSLFFVAIYHIAFAATFNVSTTQELRQSLLDAATNGQDDTIVLADGTYATTDDGGGTFTFLDNEDYDLTLQGSSAENVILSGNNIHQVLNFKVINATTTIYLESLSVMYGVSTGDGGGICSEETLEIQNCEISGNSLSPVVPFSNQAATAETEVVIEELTVPEPEISLAEEVEKLGHLGKWEEGAPEDVPAEPEITYDFPVTMNKQVEFYLDFFQNKQKSTFTRWLERSGRYLPMMQAQLKKAGLPLDLVYLPMIESGYSLTAYSRAHAAGPWQFIRSTGRMYGLEINSYMDERRNPVKSTQAAIAFLSDLYDKFGDWHLAVAAYNAGGGKINKGLKRYKTDNFWDLAQKRYLQLETKRYVPKLIAAILISKDPEKYGFTNINYEPPLAYETVEVPRWTSLRAVAVACDTDFEEIQNLNRELRKLITPPDNASYPLKVPAGRKNLVASNLAKVHTSITTSYKTHIVRKNETLTRICRKYNLNKTTLLKANNLRKSKLKKGQRLRIPYQTTTYTLWDKDTPLPSGSGSSQLVLHKVRPGETVTHISRRYNVPVHLIAGWNDLRNIHSIKAGQQIALYLEASHSAGAPSVQSSAQQLHEKTVSAPLYYNVRRGDSL